MKYLIYIFTFLFFAVSTAQNEGQLFCEEDPSGSLFPLNIAKKKLVWQNTYYYETLLGKKTIKNNEYTAIEQAWENGSKDTMYFRKDNENVVMFEECCKEETLRYSNNLPIGESWKNADKLVTYTVLSYSGTLKTPYCEYENLMVLKASFENGTFLFYYLKGHGYVGATINGNLISFESPNWN